MNYQEPELLSPATIGAFDSAGIDTGQKTRHQTTNIDHEPVVCRTNNELCTREMLKRYADHPSAYLALNSETLNFTNANNRGFIAYRPCGGYLFQFGGAFAPAEDQTSILTAFRSMADDQGKQVCALQLREHDVPYYRSAGFHINQFGASYTIDLTKFQMAGTRFMKLRNKIKRARIAGIVVKELGVEVARRPQVWDELRAVTGEWLAGKGRHVKLMDFLIGDLGSPDDQERRIMAAYHDKRLVGFICYVPSYGQYPGYMHDLTRRIPDSPPGVMELINETAIERFKSEGINYLNLGFTPLTGLSDETDNIAGRNKLMSWLMRLLAQHGEAIYPAQSQMQYKLKWHPHIITPEYIAFEGRFRLSMIWRILQLTRAI